MYNDAYKAAGERLVKAELRKRELAWTAADRAMSNKDFPHRITISSKNRISTSPSFSDFRMSRFYDYYHWCLEHVGRPCRMTPEIRNFMIQYDLKLPEGEPLWMVQTQSNTSIRFYFREAKHAVAFKLILT